MCLQLKSQIDKIEQAFEERLAIKDKQIAQMLHESKVSKLEDEMREMEEIERSLIRWSLVILPINRETSLNKP